MECQDIITKLRNILATKQSSIIMFFLIVMDLYGNSKLSVKLVAVAVDLIYMHFCAQLHTRY